MKIFQCQRCFQPIFFENTLCAGCGAQLGYLAGQSTLSAVAPHKDGGLRALAKRGARYRYCENQNHGVCNWLVPVDDPHSFCRACQTNRTIPNLENENQVEAWRELEIAKHRLIYSLLRLGLPLESKEVSPKEGLAFDFLSDDPLPPGQRISTGHAEGAITINLAEADPVYREQARTQMGEPYRTLIGHFRHEIGHYYWDRLVLTDEARLKSFRGLFGDERASYVDALQTYYQNGPQPDWRDSFLSAYATAHPWEDWAETWAHYLHLVDTLETAYAFGMRVRPNLRRQKSFRMRAAFDPYQRADFDAILETCFPLIYAVNSLNRGMGQPDLYPFVLPEPVVKKLRFIHRLCRSASRR